MTLKNNQILKNVYSLCPVCLKKIDGIVKVKEEKVIISKICKKHGKFEYPHLWDDPTVYEKLENIFQGKSKYPNGIIIDLTLRCNLKCPVCFSIGAEKEIEFHEPSIREIIKKIKRFKKQVPFSTIFLFGGEPTLRDDLFQIIKNIKKLDLDVCLFTNGLKLANSKYVRKLKKAGLDYVVLQFDGVTENTYRLLRGRKIYAEKIEAINNLKKEEIQVDFFAVIVRTVNDDEIKRIISYASENSDVVKNVYLSTITHEGRYNPKIKQITNSERLELMKKQLNITKNDFLECTEFDYHLSDFIQIMTGVKCKRLSACDIMCYLYSHDHVKITPLNRIINLRNLTEFFKKSNIILSRKHELKHIKLIANFFDFILTEKIIFRKKYLPSLLKSFLFSFKPLLHKKPIRNKFKGIFRIIVTQFQDRYNLDFDTFRYCNLWAEMPDGIVGPFCEKNILKRYY